MTLPPLPSPSTWHSRSSTLAQPSRVKRLRLSPLYSPTAPPPSRLKAVSVKVGA